MNGTIAGDVVALISEPVNGQPLLQPAMRNGKRVADLPGLAQARLHAASCLARLPDKLRRLEACYVPVEISPGIRELAAEMDRTSIPDHLP